MPALSKSSPAEIEAESPEALGKARQSERMQAQLDAVLGLLKSGNAINAHHRMKKLASDNPNDARVQAALVQTAKGVQAWGEALEAATRVVAFDPTAEAYYELARLERATLQGDPIVSLQKALLLDKSLERARALLSRYERDDRLARR